MLSVCTEVIHLPKEENAFESLGKQLKWSFRNRKTLEICGKKIDRIQLFGHEFYVDNEVPGQILDCFDNLGFVTRDDRRPLLVAKRKTSSGWHLTFSLPPGIAYSQIRAKQEWFSNAVHGWADISWGGGCVQMEIQVGEIPHSAKYQFDPAPYLGKMDLPIPIGITRMSITPEGEDDKPDVIDLAHKHMLIGGATGQGKTTFVISLIASLLQIPNVRVCLIDRKGTDFYWLQNTLIAESEEETGATLDALWKEHRRRVPILKANRVTKLADYKGDRTDLPWIVCVIDEFAEIEDKESKSQVNQLARLVRNTGISLVAATQRPDAKDVMSGSTKAQFLAKVCFRVGSEIDSRMILGEEHPEAAWLEAIPGRGIYKDGLAIREFQGLYIKPDAAEEISMRAGGRKFDVKAEEIKPELKRLPAR